MDEYYFYLSTAFIFSRSRVGKLVCMILLICGVLIKNGYA